MIRNYKDAPLISGVREMKNEPSKYGPVVDKLGIVPQGAAPSWVAARVKDERGRYRIGVGILSPGLLTKEQAIELAVKLTELAMKLPVDGT